MDISARDIEEMEQRRASLAQNVQEAGEKVEQTQAEYDAMLQKIANAESGVTGAKERRTAMQQERSRLSEEFGELKNEITEILKDIGEKLKSGEASASPLKTSAIDACKFCEMRVVCRKPG